MKHLAKIQSEFIKFASDIFAKQNFYRDDHYGPTQDKTVFCATMNDKGETGVFGVSVWTEDMIKCHDELKLSHGNVGEFKFMRERMSSDMFRNNVKTGQYYPVMREDVIEWHRQHPNLQEYYSQR